MNATKRCHQLKSLSVIGGFLDGMSIEFVDGLNCLIGHRGTGKTTVLEFVRYALDEFPKDDAGQTRRRVEALIRSNLGDGRIRLALETKDGLEYIVDRTASGEPLVLTADERPTDMRYTFRDWHMQAIGEGVVQDGVLRVPNDKPVFVVELERQRD